MYEKPSYHQLTDVCILLIISGRTQTHNTPPIRERTHMIFFLVFEQTYAKRKLSFKNYYFSNKEIDENHYLESIYDEYNLQIPINDVLRILEYL